MASDDIKVLAESTDLSRNVVQPDAEMEMVQLEVEPEVRLRDGARRSTDRIQNSRTRSGHEEET